MFCHSLLLSPCSLEMMVYIFKEACHIGNQINTGHNVHVLSLAVVVSL